MKDKHIILFFSRRNKFGPCVEHIETPKAKLTGRKGTRAGVPWYEVEYVREVLTGFKRTEFVTHTDWFSTADILFVQETLH